MIDENEKQRPIRGSPFKPTFVQAAKPRARLVCMLDLFHTICSPSRCSGSQRGMHTNLSTLERFLRRLNGFKCCANGTQPVKCTVCFSFTHIRRSLRRPYSRFALALAPGRLGSHESGLF